MNIRGERSSRIFFGRAVLVGMDAVNCPGAPLLASRPWLGQTKTRGIAPTGFRSPEMVLLPERKTGSEDQGVPPPGMPGASLLAPLMIWLRKFWSLPPVGVVREMKSKILPSFKP